MFVLDTNILIYYAAGDRKVAEFIMSSIEDGRQLIIPTICLVEFLSYSGLTDNERQNFLSFAKRFQILPLDYDNSLVAAELSLLYKLKVVDSVVAAATFNQKAMLVSRDKDFKKIKEIEVLSL